MAAVLGVVRYRVAGLAASLLSIARVEAKVSKARFGALHSHSERSSSDRTQEIFRQWFRENLQEPSVSLELNIAVVQPSIVKTGLIELDASLTEAAKLVSLARTLAERAQLKLPSLDGTVFVGTFSAEGEKLYCTASIGEVIKAMPSVRARRLVGPFTSSDASVQDIAVESAYNIHDLLRVALGGDPVSMMRLALEWLVLFDPETEGDEATLWREAERRAAENLSVLVSWFDEVRQNVPRSRAIQATLTAVRALPKFQANRDTKILEETLSTLQTEGYHLSLSGF